MLKIITQNPIAVHESTGLSPFEITFGRKANLALATMSSLPYQTILEMWKRRHEDYLEKGESLVKKTQERLRRQRDAKILRTNPIFEMCDSVLLQNVSELTNLEK